MNLSSKANGILPAATVCVKTNSLLKEMGKRNQVLARNIFYDRMIPLGKITARLPVPQLPNENYIIPNEKQFAKEIEEIKIQYQGRLGSSQEEIENEINGSLLTKIYSNQRFIRVDLAKLKLKIRETENLIGEPATQENKLRAESDRLNKEIKYKDLEELKGMILILQNDLESGNLTALEEKSKLSLKRKLETEVSKTNRYNQIMDEIKEIQSKNQQLFDQLNLERLARVNRINQFHQNNLKIDEIFNNLKVNKHVIDKLNAKENEYMSQLKKYQDYTKYKDYIVKFKTVQQVLREKGQKYSKKELKEMQNEINFEMRYEMTEETSKETTCKELLNYFKSLLPKSETNVEVKKEKVAASQKIEEDLKKGDLLILDREALISSQILSVGEGNKKKVKGPKVSKREQKSNSEFLLLSIETLRQIKVLNLTAPNKRDQIEDFVKLLELKRTELKGRKLSIDSY